MKKEKTTEVYANFNYVTTSPKKADKDAARASVNKSGKDMRGGKR